MRDARCVGENSKVVVAAIPATPPGTNSPVWVGDHTWSLLLGLDDDIEMMLVTRCGVMGGATGSAAAASRDLGGTTSCTTIVVVAVISAAIIVGFFIVGVIVTVAMVTFIVVVVVAATAAATAASMAAALIIIPVWAVVLTVPLMVTVIHRCGR